MSTITESTAILGAIRETVPLLRDHATETEARRAPHPKSMAALTEAGMFRLAVPQRYGGLEADVLTHANALREVARGCASTAWVSSVHIVGAWLVSARFPEAAQQDVFARPDAHVSALFAPSGKLEPAPGGYILDGQWAFATGSSCAQWCIVSAMGPSETGQPRLQRALVPISDLVVDDDWNTIGLAGTCSNTVRAKAVFVPSHRLEPEVPNDAAGKAYRILPMNYVLAHDSLFAVGIAQGALEQFLERLPGRPVTYSRYKDQSAAAATHLQVADAAMKIEAAGLLGGELLRSVNDAGFDFVKARLQLGYSVKLAREAVESLAQASGASSIRRGVAIQRCLRDIWAISLHGLFNVSTSLEEYGRHMVGLDAFRFA